MAVTNALKSTNNGIRLRVADDQNIIYLRNECVISAKIKGLTYRIAAQIKHCNWIAYDDVNPSLRLNAHFVLHSVSKHFDCVKSIDTVITGKEGSVFLKCGENPTDSFQLIIDFTVNCYGNTFPSLIFRGDQSIFDLKCYSSVNNFISDFHNSVQSSVQRK